MEMVKDSHGNTTRQAAPLTTVVLVEAHIEAAKLFFALSREENEFDEFSSGTLLQLALNVLLMNIPILPQIDFKLGNPYLPVDIDEYAAADLDMIDFQTGGSEMGLMELGEKIEEMEENKEAQQFFT